MWLLTIAVNRRSILGLQCISPGFYHLIVRLRKPMDLLNLEAVSEP